RAVWAERAGALGRAPRGAGEPGQLAVEGGDLGPVGRLGEVQGGDRRLQRVVAPAAKGEAAVERRPSLGDAVGVPERAVLVAEQDQGAIGEAGVAAGVVEE